MSRMDCAFSQIGGARLGWANVTIPYARLSGEQNALRLSCFGRDYEFLRSNIESLSRFRGLFSVGLRIEHIVPLYPTFVVFWVSVFRNRPFLMLKKKLEALEYSVRP